MNFKDANKYGIELANIVGTIQMLMKNKENINDIKDTIECYYPHYKLTINQINNNLYKIELYNKEKHLQHYYELTQN